MTKENRHRWDFNHNLKCLCFKGHHQKIKKQIEWERIFSNYTSDKGLVFIICKENCNSNIKNHPVKNSNRIFFR